MAFPYGGMESDCFAPNLQISPQESQVPYVFLCSAGLIKIRTSYTLKARRTSVGTYAANAGNQVRVRSQTSHNVFSEFYYTFFA